MKPTVESESWSCLANCSGEAFATAYESTGSEGELMAVGVSDGCKPKSDLKWNSSARTQGVILRAPAADLTRPKSGGESSVHPKLLQNAVPLSEVVRRAVREANLETK